MVFSALREQHAFFNLQFSKYVKNEGECFDSSRVPNTKKQLKARDRTGTV